MLIARMYFMTTVMITSAVFTLCLLAFFQRVGVGCVLFASFS